MNQSSLKFPPSLKLRRTGRRTRKIIILSLIMLCASPSYSMETEKNNPYPGSDCILGRYQVWEVEPDVQEDSDKQNAIPYALLNQLLAESDLERTFLGFLLMLVQAIR